MKIDLKAILKAILIVLAIIILCVGFVSMVARATAGDLSAQGLADPTVGHSGLPANDCAALYRKYPGKPSKALARRLNRQFAPCAWEPKKTTPKPRSPRPEPCMKRIEAWKGAIIYVPCGHVLLEGQSE